MSPVEQRDAFATGEFAKVGHRRIPGQFLSVAAGEFLESLRPMAEPQSQFWGWCNVLHPKRKFGAHLAHTPGPKPIHEDSSAVRSCRRLVNSLDFNGHAYPP